MNQFATLFPALVFLIVFFSSGKDFVLATQALMIVMTGQVIYEKISKGKVNAKLFYAWVALILLGSLTVLFRDPIFLQWKLSIINWIFAAIIIGNHLLKKPPLMKYIMGSADNAFKGMTDKNWIFVSLLWGYVFLFQGTINLYFIFYTSLTTWVNFKFFGILAINLITALIMVIYLSQQGKVDFEEKT